MAEDKLYVTNPEKWLDETAAGPDLLVLVIFRGSWCKYDQYYLHKLSHFFNTTLKDEAVQLIAWTSEGEAGAELADKKWGLTEKYGFKAVLGDDTNALAEFIKEDEILPNITTVSVEDFKSKDQLPKGSTYPKGIVMPAVVCYAHHGSPVFEWAKPYEAPEYGGPGRPHPEAIWELVEKRKHALDKGNAIMPSRGTHVRMCANDFDVATSNCIIS